VADGRTFGTQRRGLVDGLRPAVDAEAALTTERVAVLLSVAGRTLDTAAIAKLPTAQRLLLKKIRKAQVLAALR